MPKRLWLVRLSYTTRSTVSKCIQLKNASTYVEAFWFVRSSRLSSCGEESRRLVLIAAEELGDELAAGQLRVELGAALALPSIEAEPVVPDAHEVPEARYPEGTRVVEDARLVVLVWPYPPAE